MDIDDRVRKLAQWYYDRLHQDTRQNGDKFWKFCAKVSSDGKESDSLPKDEEERCRALAFAAHKRMMPDDWKYEFIDEALSTITEASDLDDIDIEADVYTSDLTRWLGSHLERLGYCDEVVEEGLCASDADMSTRLQMGQWQEKREVLGLVLQHLREEAEDEEEHETEEVQASEEA